MQLILLKTDQGNKYLNERISRMKINRLHEMQVM